MNPIFSGVFMDGKTAAQLPITLTAEGPLLILQWEDGRRALTAASVAPLHPQKRGVQFLQLADGGTCEMPASPELLDTLVQAGVGIRKDSAVAAVLHGDWRISVMALAFLAGVITAFYVSFLPSLAEMAAAVVPPSVKRQLGESALQQVQAQWLTPSELPEAEQDAIHARFDQLALALDALDRKDLELLIRKSSIGPNAFALPGNFIVLTDEMVTLVDGDLDALSGVLAHELGHLKHDHGLRSVVQGTALTMLGAALIGDYSSALAAIPAGLAHLNYSRHFETEADGFSRDVLCDAHIDPAKTALFFERVAKDQSRKAALIPPYLSSHPGSEDRAAYFHKPCPAQ